MIIGKSSPADIAIAKNVLLSKGRFGNPKETLLTPKTVWTPNVLTIETALTVSITSFCWAEAVKTRQSIIMSFLSMPYSFALLIIFLAISNLCSAFGGMPFSSKAKPMTTPPYFFTTGKTASMVSSFPLTELISGFPL